MSLYPFLPARLVGVARASNPNLTDQQPAAPSLDPVTGSMKITGTVSVTGAGSGGTSATDGDAFTAGISAGTPLMGENGTSLRVALVNAARALVIQLAKSDGTEIGTLANPIRTQEVGAGSAVSVADGSDIAEGSTTDAAVTGDNSGTVNAHLRGITKQLSAALPLPTGASTAAKQPALGTAGAASADVITIQGIASMTAVKVDASATTQPVSGTVTASAGTNLNTSALALEAGGNLATLVTNLGAVTTSPTANTLMDRVKALLTGIVLSAGSALIGKVGIDQTTPGTTNAVAITPATAGGCSISRTLSANNTTGINAKASAGQVYGWVITNNNAASRFVKLYNKATAPTVGTDTPVITLEIPGASASAGMVVADISSGIAFGTGIGYGITTGVADNDTGSPAANSVIVNLFYK